MVEVEVLIDNFKDIENFNKKIKVKRGNKEIEIEQELLQTGDTYSISKNRYEILHSKGIVKKIEKVKESKVENNE